MDYYGLDDYYDRMMEEYEKEVEDFNAKSTERAREYLEEWYGEDEEA